MLADDLSKQDMIGAHQPLMSCVCDLLTCADVDSTRYVSGTLAKLCFRNLNNQAAVVERHGAGSSGPDAADVRRCVDEVTLSAIGELSSAVRKIVLKKFA